MYVWANHGPIDDGGILNNLLFRRLFKFDVLRLGSATMDADFFIS
jgi:hypothetical protein